VEWIEKGIRINCVAPGVIYSETAAQNYTEHPDLFEKIQTMLPAKRCGTTAEVAGAVCFLLSPAAAYITGTTVDIDGASSKVSLNYHKIWDTGDTGSRPLPEYNWEERTVASKL